MASTKVVSRLSTRLQPFLFKLNKKSLSAELSSLKSSSLPTQVSVPATTRRLSRSSRLPLQLSCVESMLPLHSAVASARLISSLSSESDSWALVPQGGFGFPFLSFSPQLYARHLVSGYRLKISNLKLLSASKERGAMVARMVIVIDVRFWLQFDWLIQCLDAFMTVSFMGTFDKVKMSGCFMLHFFSLILQSQH
ncbi:hypothetical protein NC652_039762 [Populus alba x Populus x berolinensis]|nr:hypothetical protein NC652_039762 [Populus alba x Populus x berolinensis]